MKLHASPMVKSDATSYALDRSVVVVVEVPMLKHISLLALSVSLAGVAMLTTTSSSCTVSYSGEGEGEGEGGLPIGGEGEGARGGEGEGTVHTGEGEGSPAGEGEGTAAGEGEGEGSATPSEISGANCQQTAPNTNTCCADGIDNNNNTFVDCDDFACAGDSHCDVGVQPIQAFMDPNGTVKVNRGVTVANAILTAIHTASSGNVTAYVQMADGDTGGTADAYPQFSGTEVFVDHTVAANFTDIPNMHGGDCVTVSGTVDLFGSQVQLSKITAFSKTTGCGNAPTPTTTTVDKVNDAGTDRKKLRDTLVTISNVTCDLASSGNNGSFEVADGSSNKIFISGFLLSPAPNVAANTHFTSISGVLTEFDSNATPPVVHFDIDPRSASDLVQ